MTHSPVGINSPFGPRRSGFHAGVDLDTDAGDILCAPFDGILERKNASPRSDGRYFSYGWYWRIAHGNGIVTRGAHLSGWIATAGSVKAGQPIARAGGIEDAAGAGNSTGPHVHYEYEKNGQRVDPMKFGRLGALFHPLAIVTVGPSLIQWAFRLVYGKDPADAPKFYTKVRATLKAILVAFTIAYPGKDPTRSPAFVRKFFAKRGVP